MTKRNYKVEQDRHRTYNVTLRRVNEAMVAVEKQNYYILVCVCMFARACVRVGTRARKLLHAHTCT